MYADCGVVGVATNTDPNTKTRKEQGPEAPANEAPTNTDRTSAGNIPNYCFACGRDNPEGLGLQFAFDEERKSYVCRFELSRRHTGPPGHAHGGIIATILDEAMGKANRISEVTAVTQSMTVEYLRLVPLGKPLVAEGWQRSIVDVFTSTWPNCAAWRARYWRAAKADFSPSIRKKCSAGTSSKAIAGAENRTSQSRARLIGNGCARQGKWLRPAREMAAPGKGNGCA